MSEQGADLPPPEKKRKSFRRQKLSKHDLPTRTAGDVPAGLIVAKVPDDAYGDLLRAAVYDKLASPASRYQPGSYGFHTRLIAERRDISLLLQQGDLPTFSGAQLRKVRNCAPLGVRSSKWRSWPCGLIRWCPFCFLKRLYADWKEIRQRFLDKPTFRYFRLAIVEGFAVLGEAAEHLDLGSAAGLARAEAMQAGVQRVLREYLPSLARVAAWWQHTHLHPVSERSTEVGCTWRFVAVVTRRQGATFVPPADPRFSWRVRTVEVFDERELAKEFGAALSYPPEVLRGGTVRFHHARVARQAPPMIAATHGLVAVSVYRAMGVMHFGREVHGDVPKASQGTGPRPPTDPSGGFRVWEVLAGAYCPVEYGRPLARGYGPGPGIGPRRGRDGLGRAELLLFGPPEPTVFVTGERIPRRKEPSDRNGR